MEYIGFAITAYGLRQLNSIELRWTLHAYLLTVESRGVEIESISRTDYSRLQNSSQGFCRDIL